MNIALLFGSFNPIHLAHLQIAQAVVSKGLADQVWLVVSPQNPLKEASELAQFEHRVTMAKIATQNLPQIVVCEIEKELPLPSYTINTIELLTNSYPEHNFFILCGSDIHQQLDQWHRVDELKTMVDFMVYPRGKTAVSSSVFNDMELLNISSTELRNTLNHSQLPKGVCDYILLNKLYGAYSPELFYNMGREFYANGDFGNSVNSFKYALTIDPHYTPASEMLTMVNEVLAFRHIDIYNP